MWLYGKRAHGIIKRGSGFWLPRKKENNQEHLFKDKMSSIFVILSCTDSLGARDFYLPTFLLTNQTTFKLKPICNRSLSVWSDSNLPDSVYDPTLRKLSSLCYQVSYRRLEKVFLLDNSQTKPRRTIKLRYYSWRTVNYSVTVWLHVIPRTRSLTFDFGWVVIEFIVILW